MCTTSRIYQEEVGNLSTIILGFQYVGYSKAGTIHFWLSFMLNKAKLVIEKSVYEYTIHICEMTSIDLGTRLLTKGGVVAKVCRLRLHKYKKIICNKMGRHAHEKRSFIDFSAY